MSAQPSTAYALRVDGNDSARLTEWLEKDGGAFLIVRELEDSNPHFHVVLHSKKKLQALRMAFRRSFPELNGNGKYSLTEVKDLDKYERYMCKGESDAVGPTVVQTNGIKYTPQWVSETHQLYWERHAEIQSERTKKMTVLEAALEACKEANVAWADRAKIAELYIREVVRREKPINLFSVKSNVNLLQVKLCPDDAALLDLAAHCVNF